MVADAHIVADVHLVHQMVLLADDGGGFGREGTGNDHVFADGVAVADYHSAGGAGNIVQILWNAADDGILVHPVSTAHDGAFEDAGVGHDDAIVADFHVALDVGKGTDFDVLADFGRRVDVC